ncbi:MAG: hypothetical protein HY898_22590 [Deltaproteobacteria bacterium]|nr:hypothetical protein [Deltaproteobacteria bacterium]
MILCSAMLAARRFFGVVSLLVLALAAGCALLGYDFEGRLDDRDAGLAGSAGAGASDAGLGGEAGAAKGGTSGAGAGGGAAGGAMDASDGALDGPEDALWEGVTCTNGLTNCGGYCVDTSKDLNHCGTCGKACGANYVCSNSTCTCVPKCVSANACDSNGCGASCGTCAAGWDCWQGYCVKQWDTTGAWNCHEKCGGNTAADPPLTCVGALSGSCDDHETKCYCWCAVPGTCSI